MIAQAKVQINFHYGKNAMCCVCFSDESYHNLHMLHIVASIE